MRSPFKNKKLLIGSIAGLAAVAAASTIAIAGPPFGVPGQQRNIDPVYGVCRGTDPSCYNDLVGERSNAVLVYSRTAGPRHGNLGPTLDPDHPSNVALNLPRPYVLTGDYANPAAWRKPLTAGHVVQNELIRMLNLEGIAVHITEDVQAIERLSDDYAAVIFASPTRDTLWNHAAGAVGGTRLDRARETLKKYMEGGGGFVGIHNAHGTEYGWQWYEGLLGNSNYYNHGRNQLGDVVIVNNRDVSTSALPGRFQFEDEWYNLIPFPNNVNFLATVDESTLASGAGSAAHGEFHPVTWCQYYDGGRSWVTTLGHNSNSFYDPARADAGPGAAAFQTMLVHGIKSVMGLEAFCTGK